MELTKRKLEKLCEDACVIAVMKRSDGTPLYGEVVIKDDRIWVYSFCLEPPNNSLHFIPFKVLLDNFNRHFRVPNLAFLEVAIKDKVVDVVINPDKKTPRGQNFSMLCSSYETSSYINRRMIRSYYNSYLLDPGPLPVVEGIARTDSRIPWEEGTVFGMDENDSWFGISFGNDLRYSHHRIGEVISGLEELKQMFNIGKDLVVRNSGIIM